MSELSELQFQEYFIDLAAIIEQSKADNGLIHEITQSKNDREKSFYEKVKICEEDIKQLTTLISKHSGNYHSPYMDFSPESYCLSRVKLSLVLRYFKEMQSNFAAELKAWEQANE